MIRAKKLMKSFPYALEGIYLAVKLDQNVRFHLIISVIVLALSFYFRITVTEFLLVILAIFFVLITEMVNTAIEEMTNLIKQEHHVNAKVAKDVAAGAVLLSAVYAVIVGVIVFIPRILLLLS